MAFAACDYLFFYAGAATAILAPWWTVKAIGVAISGVAAAMLFALAHDAAHGSLAGSRAMNRLLATICFLPSWYPFTPWIRGHNHLHHGWTNVAECDYSWQPVSPAHYAAMPRWRRAVEHVYRSWWGLWLHSIVEIWWKHMAMPRASDRRYLNATPSCRRPAAGCRQHRRARRRVLAVRAALVNAGRRSGARAGCRRPRGRGRSVVDLPRHVLGGDVPAPHASARAVVPDEE